MKRKTAIILLFLVLFGGVISSAESKKSKLPSHLLLESAQLIFSGDNPLSIGLTSSPEVVDWNNDKRPDLMVGTFSRGKTMVFLNKGSAKKPDLDDGEVLKAGGSPLSVGSG